MINCKDIIKKYEKDAPKIPKHSINNGDRINPKMEQTTDVINCMKVYLIVVRTAE